MRTALRTVMALCALALAAPAWAAPKTMTVLSSVTYNSGGTDAIYAAVTDAGGYIYVTGVSGNDYLTKKYNNVWEQVSGILYSNGRSDNTPYGIALDGQGNIIVAGVEKNASNQQDYLVLKYSPSFVQVSSAVYDGGPVDVAKAVVTDSQDNIYVTGSSIEGTDRFYTIKYNSSLVQLATAAYNLGYTAQASAMALAGDYLIVAGRTNETDASNDIMLVRYDANLNYQDRAIFPNPGADLATGVAVDHSGNIIVVGRQVTTGVPDFLVLKYDSLLNFISSTTFDSGNADQPNGVAVDSVGNIIVTGYSGLGGAVDFVTLKYDNLLNLISSDTYDSGGTDKANAVAMDAEDNAFVAGSVYNANDDFFIVKYNASPKLTEVSPLYIGETSNVKFKGFGLVAGSSIAFADIGISTGAISVLSNQITLSVTPSSTSVLLGFTTVTVTATNGEEVTYYTLAATQLRNTVAAGLSASITAMMTEGQASVSIPAGTFAQQEIITLYTVPADASARQVGQALYLAASPAIAPLQNITITLHYREADLGATAESALALAYYDATDGWVSLTTSLNSSANTVTAVTREVNTKYSVVKPAGGSGGGGTVPGGMGGAKVYPSPYRPGSGGDFDQSALGDGIVFAGLGANQAIKITIVDLAGQLVYQKSATANADGKWLWDTKTATGGVAATGVYIYQLKGAGDLVTGKLSIIR